MWSDPAKTAWVVNLVLWYRKLGNTSSVKLNEEKGEEEKEKVEYVLT